MFEKKGMLQNSIKEMITNYAARTWGELILGLIWGESRLPTFSHILVHYFMSRYHAKPHILNCIPMVIIYINTVNLVARQKLCDKKIKI